MKSSEASSFSWIFSPTESARKRIPESPSHQLDLEIGGLAVSEGMKPSEARQSTSLFPSDCICPGQSTWEMIESENEV
jgi:hypothetical protein